MQGQAGGQADVVIGPWMAALLARYAPQRDVEWRPSASVIEWRPSALEVEWRPSAAVIISACLFVGVVITVALLHRDHAAYPSDPEKQNALEACSRADPVFIRFLSSERAACYERVRTPHVN